MPPAGRLSPCSRRIQIVNPMQLQTVIFPALLFGLILIVWLVRYYQQSYQEKISSLLAGSRVYETKLGPVEAAILGEGPPIIVLHGAGGGYDRGQVYAHPDLGYQYIVLSRPGYLRTPLTSGKTPCQQADLVAALMDALKIKKAFIMGVSAGGPTAIEFSLKFPERCMGLILSSAVNQPIPAYKFFAYAIGKYIIPSTFITWLFLNRGGLFAIRPNLAFQLFGKPEKQKQIKNLVASLWPPRPRFAGLENDMENIKDQLNYSLAEIDRPTLVIHGTSDAVISHRQGVRAADQIPGAEFISVKGGTHFCLISHSEIIQPVLLDFLDRHTS
jgi:2-hydroxy-6-oxonona-2,4-dienedioate hydrolase